MNLKRQLHIVREYLSRPSTRLSAVWFFVLGVLILSFQNCSQVAYVPPTGATAASSGNELAPAMDEDGNLVPATPTPVPGATATPTASATPVPTATPVSATPTPVPTATPAPTPTPTPAANLLNNPGFEQTMNYWNFNGTISNTSSTKYTGASGLQIGTGQGVIYQSPTLTPNLAYILSVVGKRGDPADSCEIFVNFYDSNDGEIGSASVSADVLTSSFATKTIEFTAPASFSYVQIGVYKEAGVSYCFMDDFYLRKK